MNENIICKPSPAKTLAISAAPVRELLNFLIYNRRRELLSERARKQPELFLPKIPSDARELKDVLKASRLDKNGKLFSTARKAISRLPFCCTTAERVLDSLFSLRHRVG
jgi:hypothetical protein